MLGSPLLRSCFDRVMHRVLAKEKKDNCSSRAWSGDSRSRWTPETLSLPVDQEAGLSVT